MVFGFGNKHLIVIERALNFSYFQNFQKRMETTHQRCIKCVCL